MTNSQREKGKRVERQAAAEWRRILGSDARRSVQYCGAEGHGDITVCDGVHVEVKGRKGIAALRWMEQASADARPGEVPICLMREDRGEFHLVVRFDDLPRLMEKLRDNTNSEV